MKRVLFAVTLCAGCEGRVGLFLCGAAVAIVAGGLCFVLGWAMRGLVDFGPRDGGMW